MWVKKCLEGRINFVFGCTKWQKLFTLFCNKLLLLLVQCLLMNVQIFTKVGNNLESLPEHGSWLLCLHNLQHASDVLVPADLCKTVLHAIVSVLFQAASRK